MITVKTSDLFGALLSDILTLNTINTIRNQNKLPMHIEGDLSYFEAVVEVASRSSKC